MAIDAEAAYDQMFGAFQAAWNAHSAAASPEGTVPDVEWPDVDPAAPHLADGDKSWARVSAKHNRSTQRSFGGAGQSVFTHFGTITVQVFTVAGKQGSVGGLRLGKVALDAFEGQRTADVRFRGATLREIGVADGTWYQVNVTADFEYDAIK